MAGSHGQDRWDRQVTIYGESNGLPFMGRWLPSALKSAQPTRPEPVKRYPPVGIGEGSKLWEESRSVLQGTTNFPNDPDSPHLLPMDGYLAKGKSHAGFPRPGMKGSGLWEAFCRKVAGYGVPHSSYDCEFSFYICRLAEIVQVKPEQERCSAARRYKVRSQQGHLIRTLRCRASPQAKAQTNRFHCFRHRASRLAAQGGPGDSYRAEVRKDRPAAAQDVQLADQERASTGGVRPGRTSFSISLASLSHESGLNSNNTKYVKDTVNSLISTVVNWDYLAADRSTVWKASGLLAGAGSSNRC